MSNQPSLNTADSSPAREAYITGRPPRLSPAQPESLTETERQMLAAMSNVVVDGVRKEREDRESLEILIHHADLYQAHMGLAKIFLSEGVIPLRDRELAILRIAWLSQAPFEWGAHVKIAKRNGVTGEEIERVIEGSDATGWSERDRATIRAMEELHVDSMIRDETWDVLARHYSEKQLIELTILAGQYKTVAYYQNALRLPLPASNQGLAAR